MTGPVDRIPIAELGGSSWYGPLCRAYAADRDATPFQHPGYLLLWWAAVGSREPGLTGFVAVGGRPERPAWYLPLMVRAECGHRTLRHLGDPYSDYHAPVVDAGRSRAEISAELGALLSSRAGWDRVRFGEWRSVVDPAVFPPDAWTVRSATACPYLDLTDAAATDRVLGIREYAAKRRRLDRAGRVALLECHSTPEQLRLHLDPFVAMHRAQWAGRPAVGGFDDPEVVAFFTALVTRADLAPAVRLYALTLDGTPCAYYFCFAKGGRCYGYRTTYDLTLRRESPGAVLLLEMLGTLRDGGAVEFDFMRGAYDYKRRFASGERTNRALGTRDARGEEEAG